MIKFERVEEWKIMYCQDHGCEYIRMAPESWLTRIGQEWYDVSNCSELEAAYQAWIKDHD